MSDYIKREDAIRQIVKTSAQNELDIHAIGTVIYILSEMDSADVRENVRGEWRTTYLDHVVMGERPKILYCSVCNQCIAYPTNFCPNCGADMRPSSALSENVEIVSNLKRGES